MMTAMNNLLKCMPAYHRRDRWKYGQDDTLRGRTRSIEGNPPNGDNTGCKVYEPSLHFRGRRRWGAASDGSVAGRHARHDTTLQAAPAHQGATHLTLHGTSDNRDYQDLWYALALAGRSQRQCYAMQPKKIKPIGSWT